MSAVLFRFSTVCLVGYYTGCIYVVVRYINSKNQKSFCLLLKGHGNETDFWGFCRNWFLMSPLHYLSGRSDFGFEFAEIFVYVKRLPADSPYRWVGELTTPRITDTRSRRLPASPIRRVGYWIILKENSLYRWYGESSTPRTSDTVSRRLPVSLSRRVADSAYQRYGESSTPRILESGSRWLRVSVIRGVAIRKKNLLSFDFQYFKRLKHAFKGSIWPKISQGCILLSQ
jgi:hypothetical protein